MCDYLKYILYSINHEYNIFFHLNRKKKFSNNFIQINLLIYLNGI